MDRLTPLKVNQH